MFRYLRTLLVFFFLSGLFSIAYSQDAQIQGQVLDPSGAGIAKALVRVADQRTGTEAKTETNNNGEYTVRGLAPGLYIHYVEASGFSTATSDAITLNPAQNAVLNFTLKVGGSSTEVVVTAEKREERLQDVPVPVTALDTDQLAANNQNRLQDYFDVVPGFIATPDSFDRSALSIRGISPIGGSPTVGIVIDDVPFGLSGSQQTGFVPDIDPGDLARVEVLRGPQGSLYGADSMGGLVKFVTRDPAVDAVSGRIEVGASGVSNGSDPGYNLRGSVNMPIRRVLALRASGFTRQDPGYIDNPVLHIGGINESENYGGRISGLWSPSSSFSIKLSGLYQDSKQNGLSEVDIPTAGYSQTYGLGPLQQNYLVGTGQDDLTIQDYSGVIKGRAGKFDLTSLTGYNITRIPWSVDIGFLVPPSLVAKALGDSSVVGAPYFEYDDQHKVSQEERLSTSFGEAVSVLVGGFYSHENSNGRYVIDGQNANGQIVGVYASFDQPVSSLDEYAVFGDATLHFTDKFNIQLGGRESYFNQLLGQTVSTTVGSTPTIGPPLPRSQNALTYLVDPQYKISPDLMVYARFASGYRPGAPNVVLPGAPRESAPDSNKDYEVGVKSDLLDHKVLFDGSVYYINWNDIQLQLTDQITGFKYTGNAGGAKSVGVEVSGSARPVPRLSLGATFSYDDAVLTQGFPANGQYYGVPGNRLPLTSTYSGSFSVDEEFSLPHATGLVGAVVGHVGDRLGVFVGTPQRQDLPAYTRLDLHAGMRRGTWTINLNANNVTDERGLLDGGTGYFFPPARVYITPRTVGLNVSKTF
jgi:outer membrane receptor protein involved in Fe transport